MEYIEIDKSAIPYRFQMSLNDKTYTFEVNYNNEFDFFTIDVFLREEAIFVGEKITYNKKIPLSEKYADEIDALIHIKDLSNKESRVTWDNLNETVFLYVIAGDSVE